MSLTPEQARLEIIREEQIARAARRRLEEIEDNKRRNSPYYVWRRIWEDHPDYVSSSKGVLPEDGKYIRFEHLLTTFDWDEAEAKIREERARG